ncbi:MAG: acyl-CoA dehydrogenase [Acidimicrobiia bacterium]|nr:acyl-CoA dehydrogenase [Acidimicrobiia bacterium]
MDFAWNDEQIEIRKRIIDFARTELSHDVAERDQAGEFGRDAWKRCADFGIQSMSVPAEYNTTGENTDLLTGVLAMEAIGYGYPDNGLAFALAAQMWTVQLPIVHYGTEEQKQRYLPAMCAGTLIGAHAVTEPESGSDHLALTTTAAKVDGGYRLTGSKRYISLAPVADVALVFATLDPEKGRWGLTAFLVDLPSDGVTVSEPRNKMGLRTVPMGDLEFEDCFVPEANRLGPEGAGASMSGSSLNIERTFILANQVGAMERQLEHAIEYAKTRRQFDKPIGKFQSVSNRIADMRLNLETAQLLLYKVAWMLDQGDSVTVESALLKLHLSEAFIATSLDAIRTLGGAGYMAENTVERDMRDAVGGVLYAGTSDIQRVVIARMLGL